MLRDLRTGLAEHVERVSSGVWRAGIGLKMFDQATGGGMAPGELLLVVARTGVGKTFLGLSAVYANPDYPTLFMSLEMPWAQLGLRLVTMVCGQPDWAEQSLVEQGVMPARYHEAILRYPHLRCDDRSGISMKDVADTVEAVRSQMGVVPVFVVIDYLELVRAAALDQGGLVNKVAQQSAELARHYETRVILLHQASRGEGGSGQKALSTNAARYGGDMAADYMLTAWRPGLEAGGAYQFPDEVMLAMPKHRHGIPILRGVRHRMVDGRLYEWDETPFAASQRQDPYGYDYREAGL